MRRLGMVTASRFKDVLTPPKTKKDKEAGVMGQTAKRYFYECVWEHYTQKPLDRFTAVAVDHGNEYEPIAFEACSQRLAAEGKELFFPEGEKAFIEHPTEKLIGCSPDGLIGDDGLLEIKCPFNGSIHLATADGGYVPKMHWPQIQGSLWITGRKWYLFASYDPELEGKSPPALFTKYVPRDHQYIEEELAPKVLHFRDLIVEKIVEYDLAVEAPF
jgi:hypothetical protein